MQNYLIEREATRILIFKIVNKVIEWTATYADTSAFNFYCQVPNYCNLCMVSADIISLLTHKTCNVDFNQIGIFLMSSDMYLNCLIQ